MKLSQPQLKMLRDFRDDDALKVGAKAYRNGGTLATLNSLRSRHLIGAMGLTELGRGELAKAEAKVTT